MPLPKNILTTRGRYLSCLKRIKARTPTLTIRGFTICCANELENSTEEKFDWENALIDATITSCVTFFSTLGGVSVAGLSALAGLEASIISALGQFFVFLALKRGIVQPKKTDKL
jgi:hypothetical protein